MQIIIATSVNILAAIIVTTKIVVYVKLANKLMRNKSIILYAEVFR